MDQLKKDLQKTGDLGIVAENAKASQRSIWGFSAARLTALKLFGSLKVIATSKGQAVS